MPATAPLVLDELLHAEEKALDYLNSPMPQTASAPPATNQSALDGSLDDLMIADRALELESKQAPHIAPTEAPPETAPPPVPAHAPSGGRKPLAITIAACCAIVAGGGYFHSIDTASSVTETATVAAPAAMVPLVAAPSATLAPAPVPVLASQIENAAVPAVPVPPLPASVQPVPAPPPASPALAPSASREATIAASMASSVRKVAQKPANEATAKPAQKELQTTSKRVDAKPVVAEPAAPVPPSASPAAEVHKVDGVVIVSEALIAMENDKKDPGSKFPGNLSADEIATLPVEVVPLSRSLVRSISKDVVHYRSGKSYRVGDKIPSGEMVIGILPDRNTFVTNQRVISLVAD